MALYRYFHVKEILVFSIKRVPLEGSFGTMYSAQKKSVKLVVITVTLQVRKQSWRKIGIVIDYWVGSNPGSRAHTELFCTPSA